MIFLGKISFKCFFFILLLRNYFWAYRISFCCIRVFMLPPSIRGGIFCFPRRQLIFIFDRRVNGVIYYLKGLWEYIPKSILSVCTTIFKRIAGVCFYLKCLMLYINLFVSTSSTEKIKSFFFKFQINFQIIGRKPKNIQMNSEAWILIRVQCVIYQWIRLDKLYKLMETFFFKFRIRFQIIERKPKNIQTNSEARILLKFHCIIYQWTRLDKFYKLMESFL